jgi:hypothetical protein
MAAAPPSLDPATVERLRRLLGAVPASARRVLGGYTPAGRWLLELEDGRRAFAKVAQADFTQEALLAEGRVYSALRGRLLPRCLAFDPTPPAMLVLEDLSAAHWPPPWRPGDVDAVLAMLAEMHGTPPPPGLPRLEDAAEMRSGWARVAADPAPFLSLRLASSRWLEAALPALREAEITAPLYGGALLHQDVRSDNLALGSGGAGQDGARLVDWNWAAVGNPDADLAFWLPSLASEGGPPPERLFRGDPRLAAVVSGWFASSAGLPPPPAGPRVREVQLRQLGVALPWAAAALGLDLPDGAPG